jgi:hypothetical protein
LRVIAKLTFRRIIMYRKLLFIVSFVIATGLMPAHPSQAELVGWWRFDEGSGLTVNDSSGNEHHGTVQGTPEWTDGPSGFGGALDFSQTQGAYCGVFDPTGGTGTFTLTWWCLWDGTQSIQHFCTKSNGWGATTAMFQIEVKGGHSDPARVDRLHIAYQAAPQAVLNLVPHNEWAHLALVFDGTHATGYLNGVDDVGPQPTGIGPNVDAPIIIGASHAAEGRTFMGLLDDVRLFDEVLPAERIQAIMEGGGLTYPFAYGPDPADGALHTDTWITLSWKPGDFAVSHDVYLGDNLSSVVEATPDSDVYRGNQTGLFYVAGFPGFAYPDGLAPGTTYYWRIDEVNDADPNSPWKGPIWSFSIPPKTAYNPNPADGAGLADTAVTLSWTAGFGAKLHTVYFGEDFDQVSNATVGVPTGTATYSPGPLEAERVYYWRVDEFDGLGTYKGDVWAFTTPGAVGNPQPANGATDVAMATTLSWTPADNAASHEVYLGLDKDTVRSADTASPEYKGSRTLGAESYDAGLLEPETTYYWRVDEVYNGNPVKGPVWTFTVGNYLLVDDFEGYTNDDAAGEAIWQTWVDGFGMADNGAQVGYLMPPYAEQTIVHGGGQSMPLLYANEAGVTNSEGVLRITAPRDWTVGGVGALSLWVRGDSANAAEPMYVAISNAAGAPAIVAHEEAAAAQTTSWKRWMIPLQTFADQGINLTNLDKLAIGLGSKAGTAAPGGSGTIYIDDIRLYPSGS